jgi:penicillin-binding protein 2
MVRRLVILRAVVVIAVALFLARIVQLQLFEGERNRQLADENRIRIVRRPAPRGNIYDRAGRLLATSRLAFSIAVVPEELAIAGTDDLAAGIAELLGMPMEDVEAALARPRQLPYEPKLVYRDAQKDLVARVEERSVYLSGISVLPETVRHYPHGALAAHVLGYVRQVSAEELARLESQGYRSYDLIGKAGIEKSAERSLRGTDGGEQVEVDARGRRVRTLGSVPWRPGRDVWSTIDLDVQRAAEESLGGRAGSVVAVDPRTGQVLALASHPTYDPNLFVGTLSPTEWARLSGPDHPQHNRAVMARYPPGSLLKVVTAAAALESGDCGPRSTYRCEGAYRIGDWALRCWQPGGHGAISFVEGMARSCNVVFAGLGRRVGPKALADMARRFGLGSPTGVDLPQEASGLVPTPEWKQAQRHQPWYPGDTCQMAVGQGDCLVTPMQVARLAAAVANGGWLVRPHVLVRADGDGGPLQAAASVPIGLRPSTVAALRAAMEAVVRPGGTAASIHTARYRIAGKSGTAQTPLGPPHAWFMGYAPSDDPRVALAVIVEHGESGGETAAPVARHVFDTVLLPEGERPTWPPEEPDSVQVADASEQGG